MNEFAESWNFGPADEGSITVDEMVRQFKSHWDVFEYDLCSTSQQPHEAGLLKLDCPKTRIKLNWQAVWNAVTALKKTVDWYKNYNSVHPKEFWL